MSSQTTQDWFDSTDPTGAGRGLRFRCTRCGNCCTGPEGFVLFTELEAARLAARLGVTRAEFEGRYTKETVRGRSLAEKESAFGLDCIFLDRASVPGKAVCGVYEDRPAQCRTWPFWKSNLRSGQTWALASRHCPGINQGRLIPPEQVRVLRDTVDI